MAAALSVVALLAHVAHSGGLARVHPGGQTLQGRAAITRASVEADIGRAVRQYVYGAFAIAGGLGAINAGTEVANALSGAPDAPELATAARDFGIDAVIIVVAATGWNIDRTAASKPMPATTPSRPKLAANLDALSGLKVTLRVPEPADRGSKVAIVEREVEVGTLQTQAQQVFILIVGTVTAIEDLLLSAVFAKSEFVTNNLLVVPLVFEAEEGEGGDAVEAAMAAMATKGGKGFGKRGQSLRHPPFVTDPVDLAAWSRALDAEVAAARAQGKRASPAFDPLDKGLLFVIGDEQKVMQRRLGRPVSWEGFIGEIRRETRGLPAPAPGTDSNPSSNV
jgi:hypothetical protein